MWNPFRKPSRSPAPLIHPLWATGQYVTYFLQRSDGSWAAFAIRLLGQKDGRWILAADIKTPIGEGTHWFASDPNSSDEVVDLIPLAVETVRGVPVEMLTDVRGAAQHHSMMGSVVMNLLLVRRWTEAVEAMRGASHPVAYPCGIDSAHTLVTSGPGYQKHHDLHRRVMLTGVACLAMDDGKNPITVTSFGRMDPMAPITADDADFVDFSHLKDVEHDGFALRYPATWPLRPIDAASPWSRVYRAHLGGNTCSATLSVSFFDGDPVSVTREREVILARLTNPPDSGTYGKLVPRKAVGLMLPENAIGFVSDFAHPAINGVSYSGVFGRESGHGLALVSLFGCVAKAHRYRQKLQAQMQQVFGEALVSFRFA